MAYRGKDSANDLVNGSEALGYALSPWYIDALKRSNPDSYCILDPIEEIFQFAFAVVDAETKENWNWFLEHLAIILMIDHRNIVFMSDRGRGLLDGVKEVFPNAPHSFCIKHLKDNLSGRNVHTLGLWTSLMKKMEEFKKESRNQGESFLEKLAPKNYAIACFPAKRYGEMSNSLAESNNKMLIDERCMSLLQLLKGIRVKTMNKFHERKAESSTWRSVLCPKLEKKLSKRLETGRNWRVSQSSVDVFEVCTEDSNDVVNLAEIVFLCLPLLENLPEDQRQGGSGLLVKRPDQCIANAVINLATTTAGHALQLYEQWHM
ncbi:PREDICTED: uncharacterized protein LOC101315292 [Fragaria vesca subsp. vesca]|uniref:uncharacterized protein LOC101315292 n=1 Tax=Fragaria vesca subsp. vesca TaxID=101020 RepID=UPI0002C33E94|nr:PREDICTED: uncharacterized protein LOC101315292 [Fragaria vesca subsp. vesca]